MDAHALGGLEAADPSRAHARATAAHAQCAYDSQEVALFAEAHSGVHRRAKGSPHVERVVVLTMSAIIASAACVWLREHPEALQRVRAACGALVVEAVAPVAAAESFEPLRPRPPHTTSSAPRSPALVVQRAAEVAAAPAPQQTRADTNEPLELAAATVPSNAEQVARRAPIVLEPMVLVSSRDDRTAERERTVDPPRSRRATRREHAHQAEAASVDTERSWATLRDEARRAYAARKYIEAARAYEQAARLKPRDAQTLSGLGSALLQLGDARAAVRALERATRLAPTSTSWVALGRAQALAGRARAARAAYERALALEPTNAAARRALAQL